MSGIIARIFGCLSVIKNRWYTWGEGAFAAVLLLYLAGHLSAGDSFPWRLGIFSLAIVLWGVTTWKFGWLLPRERR
jgi:hypothetical protein